jgi:DNA excision repair protein ERCC-3
VLIQVSGNYGFRQEEAQRLGRILRPKSDEPTASFYTLVSLQTCEEDFARHRQLFVTEQGYNSRIEVQKNKRQKDGARSASPSNEMVN